MIEELEDMSIHESLLFVYGGLRIDEVILLRQIRTRY